ncbi:hypothetical protein PG991_006117 [Apiospora marii]|uniref:Uncharacterized protein n=1 Tax=Apiospora marii TaxID=335849 RepID=A0ABR1SB38_9PEZI
MLSPELLLSELLMVDVVAIEPLNEAVLVVPTIELLLLLPATELLVLSDAELGPTETVVELRSMTPLLGEPSELEGLLIVDVVVPESLKEDALLVPAIELLPAEDVLAMELPALLDVALGAGELLVELLSTEPLVRELLVGAVTVAESLEEAVRVVPVSELSLVDDVLATELLLVADVVCMLGVVEEVSRSLELVDVSLDTDILEELLASEVDSPLWPVVDIVDETRLLDESATVDMLELGSDSVAVAVAEEASESLDSWLEKDVGLSVAESGPDVEGRNEVELGTLAEAVVSESIDVSVEEADVDKNVESDADDEDETFVDKLEDSDVDDEITSSVEEVAMSDVDEEEAPDPDKEVS